MKFGVQIVFLSFMLFTSLTLGAAKAVVLRVQRTAAQLDDFWKRNNPKLTESAWAESMSEKNARLHANSERLRQKWQGTLENQPERLKESLGSERVVMDSAEGLSAITDPVIAAHREFIDQAAGPKILNERDFYATSRALIATDPGGFTGTGSVETRYRTTAGDSPPKGKEWAGRVKTYTNTNLIYMDRERKTLRSQIDVLKKQPETASTKAAAEILERRMQHLEELASEYEKIRDQVITEITNDNALESAKKLDDKLKELQQAARRKELSELADITAARINGRGLFGVGPGVGTRAKAK